MGKRNEGRASADSGLTASAPRVEHLFHRVADDLRHMAGQDRRPPIQLADLSIQFWTLESIAIACRWVVVGGTMGDDRRSAIL
jgi:hypothetical protein